MATTVKGRIPNYGDPLKENYGPWTIANQPQGPNNPLLLDWIAEKFGNAGLLEAVIENQVVSGGGVPRSDAPFISTLRNNNKQTPNKDDIKVVIEKKMPQPLATPREPPSVSQPAGLNWQPFKGLSDTVSRGNPLDATEYRNPLPETSLPDGLLSAQDATGMGRGDVLGDEPPVDEGTEEKGLLDRAGDFISRKWEGRDKTPMDSPMNRGLIEFGLRAMNPDSYYGKDGFGIGALGGLSASAQGGLAQHDKITEMLAKKEDRAFNRAMKERMAGYEGRKVATGEAGVVANLSIAGAKLEQAGKKMGLERDKYESNKQYKKRQLDLQETVNNSLAKHRQQADQLWSHPDYPGMPLTRDQLVKLAATASSYKDKQDIITAIQSLKTGKAPKKKEGKDVIKSFMENVTPYNAGPAGGGKSETKEQRLARLKKQQG